MTMVEGLIIELMRLIDYNSLGYSNRNSVDYGIDVVKGKLIWRIRNYLKVTNAHSIKKMKVHPSKCRKSDQNDMNTSEHTAKTETLTPRLYGLSKNHKQTSLIVPIVIITDSLTFDLAKYLFV